jgi:hypothetical protein
MRVVNFFKNLIQEAQLKRKHLRFFIAVVSLLFFSTTLIHLSLEIRETSTSKGILYATDNDSGRAIQTAQLSHWYKSNHFAPYGNLYFRIAHTLAKISPANENPGWSQAENEDIRHHFALALTSLFALAILAIFLAYLLLRDVVWSLLVGNVLFHIGIIDQTWTYFIFRAHPDHLLMLFVSFAIYFTLRYSSTLSRRDFILAGLTWGVATATKTVTILFIPSFLFLFFSQGLNKESVKKGLAFIGYMLIAYLIIGFPQNFGFYKHLNFLLHESKSSRMGNMFSIQQFAILIFDQTKFLILAFIPLHLFFGKQEKLLNWRMLGFLGIALLVLFSRRMLMPQTHHPMPFVAMILVVVIFGLKLISPLKFKYKQLLLVVTSLAALILLNDFPKSIADQKKAQLHCRSEIITLLNKVKEMQKDGSQLVREPYFPFESGNEKTKQVWGIKISDLDKYEAQLFGTKRFFGQQYLTDYPNDPNKTKEEWDRNQAFYKKVLFDDSFTTPAGRKFKKIHEDECGFMLFQEEK